MAAAFQPQRLTVRPHKTLGTAVFLAAMLIIQMLAGCSLIRAIFEPVLPVPLINANIPTKIPGEYIVIFKPGISPDVVLAVQNKATRLGGTIKHVYQLALVGFSAQLPNIALHALRADPSIAFIEQDQNGTPNITITQPPKPNSPPPVGLDRTSERGIQPNLLLDGKYTYSEKGTGVHVYVIDKGIDHNHSEFAGRVLSGKKVSSLTLPTDPPDPNLNNTDDCSGHGTAIAGTIGGSTLGIAKDALLHPVRVTDCGGSNPYAISDFVKAVEWVKAQRIDPAVVNLSMGWQSDPNNSLAIAVKDSIESGITYVVAGGNGNGADACGSSPGKESMAITVGASVIDEVNQHDTRWPGSNIGSCLDLFAPGQNILTAKPDNALYCTQDADTSTTLGSMTQKCSGTSIAAPHVTGVVARYLQTHPAATPAQVWSALHVANNIQGTTMGWSGIIDPGTGSPNELLHYGPHSDGYSDGDTHILTVNGIHYDFQAAGEFVALRDANGLEIQTRQTPVSGKEHVSINTAIAARVGQHRVTWQPNLSGQPDPSGLQLRVDGDLAMIGVDGQDLEGGGHLAMLDDGHTLKIDFPDGTTLIAASHWWDHRQQWYLSVKIFHSPGTEGIIGAIKQDSWKQQEFAETWRVTDETSLFDYAPGVSTRNFTPQNVPAESKPQVTPEQKAFAQHECDGITNEHLLKDCQFDVAMTEDPIFAKSARILQKIQHGATHLTVTMRKQYSRVAEEAVLTATVTSHEQGGRRPSGAVMFMYDGKPMDCPVSLDTHGQAKFKTWFVMVRDHVITAKYIPDKGSAFLPSSSSFGELRTVKYRETPRKGESQKTSDGIKEPASEESLPRHRLRMNE